MRSGDSTQHRSAEKSSSAPRPGAPSCNVRDTDLVNTVIEDIATGAVYIDDLGSRGSRNPGVERYTTAMV
ncbi:unnamed protein product [Penicillium roqueforti FM164]|uniref:Genomic scaffold, ProqFM164S02 n=1 Tax=Penicillium roqueforti (strain FM164) TaxID=1365484 RepID=W6Q0X4_PENRF|nr:unnamed protein product [Penicillium roqueforti FM164]